MLSAFSLYVHTKIKKLHLFFEPFSNLLFVPEHIIIEGSGRGNNIKVFGMQNSLLLVIPFKYVLKRVSFGNKDCTKELKLEHAYFEGQFLVSMRTDSI